MERPNQSGVAHLIVVFMLVILVVIGLVGFRVISRDKSDSNTNVDTSNQQAPQLFNFGLASVNPESGDVSITTDALREYESRGLKGFYVFGDTLEGNRRNPNFEFSSVKPGSNVIAATDGVVVEVKQQAESNDYEVIIVPNPNSSWSIGYDHLTNISVKKGDPVKVGAVLGEPSVQNNGLLRFELQVNNDSEGQTNHVCPSTLLADEVRSTQLADLAAMQTAWNTLSGQTIYELGSQNPVGCLVQTLTLNQAEGR